MLELNRVILKLLRNIWYIFTILKIEINAFLSLLIVLKVLKVKHKLSASSLPLPLAFISYLWLLSYHTFFLTLVARVRVTSKALST